MIIFLTGAPATGKTTLLNRLSRDLGIGFVAKDSLKELLFDTLGAPVDKSESEAYGKAVIQSLFLTAQHVAPRRNFIFEAALIPKYAKENILELKELGISVVQVHCHCPAELRYERTKNRAESGERHPAHDAVIAGRTLEDFKARDKLYRPLDIKDTYSVNTSNFDDHEYEVLVEWLRSKVG